MFARWSRLAIALLSLPAVSCETCGTPREQEPAVQAVPEKKPAETVLTGVVRLAPGAELPAYTAEEMEHRILRHARGEAPPTQCTPPRHDDRRPVKLSADGSLAGVMVAASEFSPRTKTPPRVHPVAIEDCRLSPALIVGKRGDVLRMENRVDYPFMPMYGTGDFAQTMNKGDIKDFSLDQSGVRALRCGVTAPCGRADVVVLYHDLFGVSDVEGRFRIEGFPPDETIQLHAWHPLFEETKLSVKVQKGETKEIEIVLTPLPPKPAPAPDAGAKAKMPG